MATPSDCPDLEAVYDAEIAPLMRRIIAVCKEHGLPMFATFQYAPDKESEGDVKLCTTTIATQPYTHPMLREFHYRIYGRPVALAETITTQPDGSQAISIRRMS